MTIAIRSQLPNVIAILSSMGAAGELVGTPCLFLSQGQKGTFRALTEGTHPEIHSDDCLLTSDNFNTVKSANTPNPQGSNGKLWLLKHEIGTQIAWIDEIGPNRCDRLLLVVFSFTIKTVL